MPIFLVFVIALNYRNYSELLSVSGVCVPLLNWLTHVNTHAIFLIVLLQIFACQVLTGVIVTWNWKKNLRLDLALGLSTAYTSDKLDDIIQECQARTILYYWSAR